MEIPGGAGIPNNVRVVGADIEVYVFIDKTGISGAPSHEIRRRLFIKPGERSEFMVT